MADPNTIKGQPEGAPEVHSPEKVSTPSLEPRQVSGSREGIAQTLMPGEAGAESGADSIESGEVRETVAEGGEVKGDGAKTGQKKDDKGKKDDRKQGDDNFTFDEQNLPPAPDMIRKIELILRSEIKQLEKKMKKYEGNLFRSPDYPMLSETVGEIRKKRILLRRLAQFAYDALKKLFVQMFAPKKTS